MAEEGYSPFMRLISRFCGFMAAASFLAIPVALFSDSSTGDNAYTVSDAFFAWIFFSIFCSFKTKIAGSIPAGGSYKCYTSVNK